LDTVVVYGDVFLEHEPRDYHPENPGRLRIAMAALENAGILERVELSEPRQCSPEDLRLVHDPEYIELVRRLSERGYTYIDGDTYVSPGTWRAALHAAGSLIEAAEESLDGEAIVVLCRPPGHHAGVAGRALGAPTLGFCIFNNIALAAKHLVERRGLRPVLIVDIDLHHGNGTQEVFWEDPRVYHVDLHEWGIYPGTGWITDVGDGEGEGTKINVALYRGVDEDDYAYIWRELVEPIIESVRPRAIGVSAGFDAFENDFTGTTALRERIYRFIGASLARLAREMGTGIFIALEGGYSYGLSRGLPAFIEGILSEEAEESFEEPSPRARELVEEIRKVVSEYIAL